MFKKSISVVYPAYNEQENIKKTLESTIKFLIKNFKSYEVIVVDDGSSDSTKEIVLEYRKNDRHVRLIEHKKNIGYGGAVWDGIKAAKKDLVFFSDSDRQFNINQVKEFVKKIDEYDVVLGYRKKRNDRFMRKLNAFGWKIVCFLMLGLKIKDIDCAFKLFKREQVQKIRIKSVGATFSAELLYKLQKQGSSFLEKPVDHYPRKAGRATGAKLSVILKAFDEIWQVYSIDKKLVKSRMAIALTISAILLLLSRILFISGSADFFDSNQYFWRTQTPEILKALATGHAPFHPLYIFFSTVFYKMGFDNVAIASALPSAIFGSLSIIFLFLSLRKLFGSKVAYLSSFLYGISAYVWISQITTLVDATEHCFYFLSFYLLLGAFERENKRPYLNAIFAGISIGLAGFAHTQVGLWVMPLIIVPLVLISPNKTEITKYLKIIGLYLLFGGIWLGGYLYLMHLAPSFQPEVSKPQSILENFKYLTIGNISDKEAFSPVFLFRYLRYLASSLIVLLSVFGFIELTIKKFKSSLLLIILALPLIPASSYIYENLYSRALFIGLVPVFVYASYFILQRRSHLRNVLLLAVVAQLLVISYPAVLSYKRLSARNETLAKQQREVMQGGVFIGTNVNKTWASYDGDFVPLGDVGYGAGYAKDRVVKALEAGKPAYLSAVAIKWPLRRFDGMHYDIRTLDATKDIPRGTILNEVFDQFSLDLENVNDTDSDLAVYKVSDENKIDFEKIEDALETASSGEILFGQVKQERAVRNLLVSAYANDKCSLNSRYLSRYDLFSCVQRAIAREDSLDNWSFTDKRGFFIMPTREHSSIVADVLPTATNDGTSSEAFFQKRSQKLEGNLILEAQRIDDLKAAIQEIEGSYYVEAKRASNNNAYKLYEFDLNLGTTTRLEAELLSGQIGDIRKVRNTSEGRVRINRPTNQDGYIISGPYINLKKGNYKLSYFVKAMTSGSELMFDAVGDFGRESLGGVKVSESDLNASYKEIELDLNLEKDTESVEFRIFVPAQSSVSVDYLELKKL